MTSDTRVRGEGAGGGNVCKSYHRKITNNPKEKIGKRSKPIILQKGNTNHT